MENNTENNTESSAENSTTADKTTILLSNNVVLSKFESFPL
jgi:hypothetical protein